MKTPLDKKLIGDQDKLPEALKAKIEAAPESPAKFTAGVMAGVGGLGGESAYDFTQGQGILDAG